MNNAIRLFIFSVLILVGALALADSPEDYIARIEGPQPGDAETDKLTLSELMDHFYVPGLSVAVIHDFEIHWAKGYGIADTDADTLVTTDTAFQAASISKPVAALIALRAAEDGHFDLNQPVNDLLTSWRLPDNEWSETKAVTPRMLLSHTGGTTVHGFPGYDPDDAIPSVPDLLSGEGNTAAVIVDIEPFTQHRYSGGGSTIMQLAIADVFQRPYPELARAYVLHPLGMNRSGYWQPLPPEQEPFAARSHTGRGRRMATAPWHVYPELAAAGLWTTPTDLATFAIAIQRALRGDTVEGVSQDIALKMTTPPGVGNYALGFSIAERPDGRYFMHGGSNWGFRCLLVAHTEDGHGFVAMTNAERGSELISELQTRIARAYGQIGNE